MLVCPQTQSGNVLTSCVRLCIHVCNRPPVKACWARIVQVVEKCGNVFYGNMLCVLCLPLFGALNGAEHQRVLCARGTHRGHSRLGVKLQAMESAQRAWKGGRESLSLHHSRTQQRQNLWRLPPTEGGGVTGAKYACTLMLGRWVCGRKQTTCDTAWKSYKCSKTAVEFTHSCDFVHPESYLKQFKLITWNHNLTQKSKKTKNKNKTLHVKMFYCALTSVIALCRPLSISVRTHCKNTHIWRGKYVEVLHI